jgi:hypothetical protein
MSLKGKITKSQADSLAEGAEEIELTPEEIEINMRSSTVVDVVPDSDREVPVEFMIGKTKHFRNGNYETRDEKYQNVILKGNIYEFYDIVGAQYNQLKGKLYNMIESVGLTDKQERAVKGLIKDFCNAKYKYTVQDLEGWVNRMGFDIGQYGMMESNPLVDMDREEKVN